MSNATLDTLKENIRTLDRHYRPKWLNTVNLGFINQNSFIIEAKDNEGINWFFNKFRLQINNIKYKTTTKPQITFTLYNNYNENDLNEGKLWTITLDVATITKGISNGNTVKVLIEAEQLFPLNDWQITFLGGFVGNGATQSSLQTLTPIHSSINSEALYGAVLVVSVSSGSENTSTKQEFNNESKEYTYQFAPTIVSKRE